MPLKRDSSAVFYTASSPSLLVHAARFLCDDVDHAQKSEVAVDRCELGPRTTSMRSTCSMGSSMTDGLTDDVSRVIDVELTSSLTSCVEREWHATDGDKGLAHGGAEGLNPGDQRHGLPNRRDAEGLEFHRRQILVGPLLLSVGVRYGAAETKQHTQQQRYLTLHLVMAARGTHDVGSLQAKVWLCPRAGLGSDQLRLSFTLKWLPLCDIL